MIQIIFAIRSLFISSMLLGMIIVTSMNMQKVTATTNTHTMNVIGAPNQSAAAGNNIEMTYSTLAKKLMSSPQFLR